MELIHSMPSIRKWMRCSFSWRNWSKPRSKIFWRNHLWFRSERKRRKVKVVVVWSSDLWRQSRSNHLRESCLGATHKMRLLCQSMMITIRSSIIGANFRWISSRSPKWTTCLKPPCTCKTRQAGPSMAKIMMKRSLCASYTRAREGKPRPAISPPTSKKRRTLLKMTIVFQSRR